MNDFALSDKVTLLLRQQGLAQCSVQLRPCVAGGNNRVYFVEGAAVPIVAKSYFKSPADTRNRLQAEWSFINYAYSSGMRCVPKPLVADFDGQLALYENVDGRKLSAAEIGHDEVRAAADFVRTLNEPSRRVTADALPSASEAAFSITEQFALIDRRLDRLVTATASADTDVATRDFVADLRATWQALKISIAKRAVSKGIVIDDVLPVESRWISPSDFGFHNALKRPNGDICFIDFEYAGWDDPAKLIADFFLQPAVCVDIRYLDGFIAQATGGDLPSKLRARIEILQPLFALKWCIIMMNPFVAERAEAGSFANPSRDQTERKKFQLAKAVAAMQAMQLSRQEWHM
jgi:hypothetical protein